MGGSYEKVKMEEVAPMPRSESVMLVANKCSHVISKCYSAAKDQRRSNKYSQQRNTIISPKVRIVYVNEPNIIKTDPQNFRSLVQRLTGKSTNKSKGKKRQMNHKRPSSEIISVDVRTENLEYIFCSNDQLPIIENKSTTKFSTEECCDLSKGFSDMDMIFQNEIPLVMNLSPFDNMHNQIGRFVDGLENC